MGLIKGPNRVRVRLAMWYLSGPALFTYATFVDPEGGNASSPFYNAIMAVSLGLACGLPALWLWLGRTKASAAPALL